MTKKDLKIVFFGTPEFAVASLDALVAGGYNVAAVVTMPDKASGRGQHVNFSAVKKYALAHDLPVLQPERLKDETFVETLRGIGADLFIVIAFRMLPEIVWSMPPMGTFNLHGSLLPHYRGAAPINRAVMNGEKTTGVTTFMLKKEIDTGDILCREAIEIGDDENVGSVHDRLMEIGARLTVKTVDDLIAGKLVPMPQDDILKGEEATPAPKIFKEDCHIDWNDAAAKIHNQVRGLSPYPAAWTTMTLGADDSAGVLVKVLATRRAASAPSLAPGQLALSGKKAYVGCGEREALELLEVQPAGKRPMAATDYLRGLRIGENGRQPRFV
ncbi:MAG: methionyl-tRNA formyltransferase [Muribaculaceae bacterium]|nr:methionyl-tRNA formyltransferase [Muribaculaceae bacterium]